MDDLIKQLRILAIREDKNRKKAVDYLRMIENELTFALFRIYGKNGDRSHSKLVVHEDEGLVFIYNYLDSPDKEGFFFQHKKGFDTQYSRLSEESGERFWVGIETVIKWIHTTIAKIVEEEKERLAIIDDLEKLTASVKEKYNPTDKEKADTK